MAATFEFCSLRSDMLIVHRIQCAPAVTQQYKSITIQKALCNQSNRNLDNFCYAKEATTKSTVFAVNKDEWNTKEDT